MATPKKRLRAQVTVGHEADGTAIYKWANGRTNEYVGAVRHRDSAWLDTRVGEIGQLRRRD